MGAVETADSQMNDRWPQLAAVVGGHGNLTGECRQVGLVERARANLHGPVWYVYAGVNGSDVLHRRLFNQQLAAPRLDTPVSLVGWLGAVQAQDYAGARWGLGLRLPGSSEASLDRAFDAGEILRTHVLRPTWHFVAPADIRWMLQLTAPRVKTAIGYYGRALGLDDNVLERSHAVLVGALQGGRQLTRSELAAIVRASGLPSEGPPLGHLLMHAELDGLICSGAHRGAQVTFALLDERVPSAAPLSRDEALAQLVKRYYSSHGPATVRDFVWWSGLTVADARRGIAMLGAALARETIDGLEYWFAANGVEPPPPPAGSAYLLPNYDEYTVAYRDRDVYYDAALGAHLPRRYNVPFDHSIVIGGRVIGMWRRSVSREAVAVETRLMTELDPTALSAVQTAAERYARFLGLPLVMNGRSSLAG